MGKTVKDKKKQGVRLVFEDNCGLGWTFVSCGPVRRDLGKQEISDDRK